MLQVVEFNKELKDKILGLENKCLTICEKVYKIYEADFQKIGAHLFLEYTRTVKGKMAESTSIFENNYESYIEIGFEEEEEYFPNAYIPIWRCKKEIFQDVGYITQYDPSGIEKKVIVIVEEMLHEKLEEAQS